MKDDESIVKGISSFSSGVKTMDKEGSSKKDSPKTEKSTRMGGKKSDDDDRMLPLCVVDERGFAISKSDPRFTDGITLFSSVSIIEAQNELSEILGALSAYTGIVGTVLGGVAAGVSLACPPCAVALGVLAALAALNSIIFGLLSSATADLSEGEVEILNLLNMVNSEIQLSRRITERAFATLRRDIGDQTLDEIANTLDRMSSSYMDFVDVAQLNATTFNGTEAELGRIQESYRDQFR